MNCNPKQQRPESDLRSALRRTRPSGCASISATRERSSGWTCFSMKFARRDRVFIAYLRGASRVSRTPVVRAYCLPDTVAERLFVATESIHAVRAPAGDLERRVSGSVDGLEHPAVRFLAVVLHAVGSGRAGEDHVGGSVAALQSIAQHLQA